MGFNWLIAISITKRKRSILNRVSLAFLAASAYGQV